MKLRRQRRQMNRRSIGRSHWSIRCIKKSRQRGFCAEGLSIRCTDRGSNGSSDGFEDLNRKVLAWNPSAPDEPTVSRGASVYASDEWRQQSCNSYVT
jgi:hypothetical protein